MIARSYTITSLLMVFTDGMVVATGHVHNLHIRDGRWVAPFAALHEHRDAAGGGFELVGQFVARNKVFAVRVVAQLTVLGAAEGVEVAFLVKDHAELCTTSNLHAQPKSQFSCQHLHKKKKKKKKKKKSNCITRKELSEKYNE